MNKIQPLILSLLLMPFANFANAFCPVCTVAVGFGVGLSRWLGIDDTISGVWIGGLTVALVMWFVDWLNKKEINFKFREAIITISFYALIVLPLFYVGIINHPLNKLWGIDKLLVGIIVGSLAFVVGVWIDSILMKINNQKQYILLQKVIMSLLMLILATGIFYWIVY